MPAQCAGACATCADVIKQTGTPGWHYELWALHPSVNEQTRLNANAKTAQAALMQISIGSFLALLGQTSRGFTEL